MSISRNDQYELVPAFGPRGLVVIRLVGLFDCPAGENSRLFLRPITACLDILHTTWSCKLLGSRYYFPANPGLNCKVDVKLFLDSRMVFGSEFAVIGSTLVLTMALLKRLRITSLMLPLFVHTDHTGI